MKQKAFAFIQSFRPTLARNKKWIVLFVLAVLLAPPSARAAGIGDILTLFKTITSTIQGAIGGALSGIQTLNSTINSFRQQIIWPLAQINQAKAFVTYPSAVRRPDVPGPVDQEQQRHAHKPLTVGISVSKRAIRIDWPIPALVHQCLWQCPFLQQRPCSAAQHGR